MNHLRLSLIALPAALCVSGLTAATVTLTADNAAGTSSFDTATGWSNAAAPSAGNDYDSNGFTLRTPATTTSAYTFAGDSLTVTGANNLNTAAPDLSDTLMFKGTLAGTTTITINNLTFNGAVLRNGSGDTNIFRLAGNGLTVGATGMGVHVQGATYIDAAVKGSGTIYLYGSGATTASRQLHFTSTSNTYNGSVVLFTANQSRFTLDDNAVFNFKLSGTATNSISGTGVGTYAGDINIDTSAADLTAGNTWTLFSVSSHSFASTFVVNGFTEAGTTGLWTSNDGQFTFSETTGVLTLAAIPEPAACAVLLGVGVLGVVARKRRRPLAS